MSGEYVVAAASIPLAMTSRVNSIGWTDHHGRSGENPVVLVWFRFMSACIAKFVPDSAE
jgi:hypothetical protein